MLAGPLNPAADRQVYRLDRAAMVLTSLLALSVLVLSLVLSAAPAAAAVRPPAVAGRFYPDDPVKLRAAVDAFLRDGRPAGSDRPVVLVAPHAG